MVPVALLAELSIGNYAVIDRLRLRLGPGFNVLTGETGAGKSIIIGALSFVLGERADPGVIRAGESEATVEAIFDLEAELPPAIAQRLPDLSDEATLILTREISSSGRTTCRLNARAVPMRLIQEVGMHLVDVHGQGAHLSLLRVSEHVDLIDRFGGLLDLRKQLAGEVRRIVAVRGEMSRLRVERARAVERADLLSFQVNEISAARLKEGEEEALIAERTLQVNAEKISGLLAAACEALEQQEVSSSQGALDLISQAAGALTALERLDPTFESYRKAAETLQYQVQDLRRELTAFLSGIEFDPRRLAEVQERIDVISGLKRKYGPTIGDISSFADRAHGELNSLSRAESSMAELAAELEELIERAAKLAGTLSLARRDAAGRLTSGVEGHLEGLGMPGAKLAVQFSHQTSSDGFPIHELGFDLADAVIDTGSTMEADEVHRGPLRFDATGVDRVEFLISANPGEPLRPLARVASGGETARLMLAIKNVLSEADMVPTLVFDEVDAGIGGRVAEAVGIRLRSLGRRHQVLAVTHLPQIACYADAHLRVTKQLSAGRTITNVVPVENEERVLELSQMLGADTPATRTKAAELLRLGVEGGPYGDPDWEGDTGEDL
jgi:DNA repair protein RecN (Recombination protein N)